LDKTGGWFTSVGLPKRKSSGDAADVVEIATQIAAAAIARSARPGMFPAPANTKAPFIVGLKVGLPGRAHSVIFAPLRPRQRYEACNRARKGVRAQPRRLPPPPTQDWLPPRSTRRQRRRSRNDGGFCRRCRDRSIPHGD